MSNSAISPNQVYLGSWINWSRGPILGATLTISQGHGNLLIAFTALFVAFAGTCCFRVSCFVFHRMLSKRTAQDGIYHQRQAILRNSANGVTAMYEMGQLMWSWRKKKHLAIRRMLPIFLYVGISISAFAVAGVFSSNIAAMTGDEVLMKYSPFCGRFSVQRNISFEETTTRRVPDTTQNLISFVNYAQDCYTGNATEGRCNMLIKSRLDSNVERNASCPFAESICQSPNGNIRLDTGPLNSDTDLGINAPESERMSYRRVLHCSPLVAEGFEQNYNRSGVPYARYYYGRQTFNQSRQSTNHTYEHSQVALPLDSGITNLPSYDIVVRTVFKYKGRLTRDSDVDPIPALNRVDADVYLIFLSANDILYPKEVNDPWYSAHRASGIPVGSQQDPDRSGDTYLADHAASTLGCAVQYQICVHINSGNKYCSPLSSTLDTMGFKVPGTSEKQMMRLTQFIYTSQKFEGILTLLSSLGTAALMSRYSLYQGVQAPLRDNQWQLDVERWHNATLAGIQNGFIYAAAGLPELLRPIYNIIKNEHTDYSCANQKIKSTAYANFSIFGLSFIFIFGIIFILTNYILESDLHYPVVRCVSRKASDKVRYHRLEWYANGTLQLQRLAHEQTGYGKWSRCDTEIPVTEAGDQLSPLDLEDPKHPRLQRAPPLSLNSQVFFNTTEAREIAFSRRRMESDNTLVVCNPGAATTGMPPPSRMDSDITMTADREVEEKRRGTGTRRNWLALSHRPFFLRNQMQAALPLQQEHQNKPKSWFPSSQSR